MTTSVRSRLSLLPWLLVAAAACGGSSATADLGAGDAAIAATADLPAVVADMAEPLGCRSLLFCLQPCMADAACQKACLDRGSMAGAMKFKALGDCSMAECQRPASPTDGGSDDAGVAPCAAGAEGSAACLSCLTLAAQSKACSAQFGACFGDG